MTRMFSHTIHHDDPSGDDRAKHHSLRKLKTFWSGVPGFSVVDALRPLFPTLGRRTASRRDSQGLWRPGSCVHSRSSLVTVRFHCRLCEERRGECQPVVSRCSAGRVELVGWDQLGERVLTQHRGHDQCGVDQIVWNGGPVHIWRTKQNLSRAKNPFRDGRQRTTAPSRSRLSDRPVEPCLERTCELHRRVRPGFFRRDPCGACG